MELNIALVRFKYSVEEYMVNFHVSPGDYVVVEADRGENIGVVQAVDHRPILAPKYNRILQFASREDILSLVTQRELEREVCSYITALTTAPQHNFPRIRVIDCEFQSDGSKLTVYYDTSVVADFRRLSRQLYHRYLCRIWFAELPIKEKKKIDGTRD